MDDENLFAEDVWMKIRKKNWDVPQIPNTSFEIISQMKEFNRRKDRHYVLHDLNTSIWFGKIEGVIRGFPFDNDDNKKKYKDITENSDSDESENEDLYCTPASNKGNLDKSFVVERTPEKDYRPKQCDTQLIHLQCGLYARRYVHSGNYASVISVYESDMIDQYLNNCDNILWNYPLSSGKMLDYSISYLGVLNFLTRYKKGEISDRITKYDHRRNWYVQKFRRTYDCYFTKDTPLLYKLMEYNKNPYFLCYCLDYWEIDTFEKIEKKYIPLDESETSEIEQKVLTTSLQGSHKISSNRFIQNTPNEISEQMHKYTYTGKKKRKMPSQKKICPCNKKRRLNHFKHRNVEELELEGVHKVESCMPIFIFNREIYGTKFHSGHAVPYQSVTNMLRYKHIKNNKLIVGKPVNETITYKERRDIELCENDSLNRKLAVYEINTTLDALLYEFVFQETPIINNYQSMMKVINAMSVIYNSKRS